MAPVLNLKIYYRLAQRHRIDPRGDLIHSTAPTGDRLFAATQRSLRRRFLRLILVVIIVVAVVLIRGIVRLVALVVPKPSIDAVGGEQLGMRTAFDRLAA